MAHQSTYGADQHIVKRNNSSMYLHILADTRLPMQYNALFVQSV